MRKILGLLCFTACGSNDPSLTLVDSQLRITWEDNSVRPVEDQLTSIYDLFRTNIGEVRTEWEFYWVAEINQHLYGATYLETAYTEIMWTPEVCSSSFYHELLHIWLYQEAGPSRRPYDGDPRHLNPLWQDLPACRE